MAPVRGRGRAFLFLRGSWGPSGPPGKGGFGDRHGALPPRRGEPSADGNTRRPLAAAVGGGKSPAIGSGLGSSGAKEAGHGGGRSLRFPFRGAKEQAPLIRGDGSWSGPRLSSVAMGRGDGGTSHRFSRGAGYTRCTRSNTSLSCTPRIRVLCRTEVTPQSKRRLKNRIGEEFLITGGNAYDGMF